MMKRKCFTLLIAEGERLVKEMKYLEADDPQYLVRLQRLEQITKLVNEERESRSKSSKWIDVGRLIIDGVWKMGMLGVVVLGYDYEHGGNIVTSDVLRNVSKVALRPPKE